MWAFLEQKRVRGDPDVGREDVEIGSRAPFQAFTRHMSQRDCRCFRFGSIVEAFRFQK